MREKGFFFKLKRGTLSVPLRKEGNTELLLIK